MTRSSSSMPPSAPSQPGTVALVGAGPGDPDLITLRGLRAIERAEVILYDRLLPRELLDYASPECEQVFVGKTAGRHPLPQETITALLVEKAQGHRYIVRLKGGDPFIFGRGGEEAEALAAAGVPFEVVPGVTAASACGAYAGIPLTHRGATPGVTFITGHRRGPELDLDWANLAASGNTLVFYMGLSNLPSIAVNLMNHGLAGSTPAALIQEGATASQQVWTANLAGLPALGAEESVRPPVLIVIGEVVRMREHLAWFEQLGRGVSGTPTPFPHAR